MKKKKTVSMKYRFYSFIFLDVGEMIFLIASTILFIILYGKFNHEWALWVAIGNFLFGISMLIAGTMYIAKYYHIIYHKGLYETTSKNIKLLAENKSGLAQYPDVHIKELEDHNKDFEKLSTITHLSERITFEVDYSKVPLKFVNEEKNLADYESFTENLNALIALSQTFRNLIIEMHYNLTDETLSDEDYKNLINVLEINFKHYTDKIYVRGKDSRSILLYLPHFDSIKLVEECLYNIVKDSTIMKRENGSINTYQARFAAVCYPYSSLKELIPDLTYAKRQNKPMFFYLPDRINKLENKIYVQSSMNLNQMTRMLKDVSRLKADDSFDYDRHIINEILNNAATYLNFDYAGMIIYDAVQKVYRAEGNICNNGDPLFREREVIDVSLINAVNESIEEDNSIYFSARAHLGVELGRELDKLAITSGLIHAAYRKGENIGIIYFWNKNRDCLLNSYLRESLVIICERITYAFKAMLDAEDMKDAFDEFDSMLMLSDFSTYRINDATYKIISFSRDLPSIAKDVKIGATCYNALYGLDKPCKQCPMRTFKKMLSVIGKDKFETSLTLNDKKSHSRRMLLRNMNENQEVSERFDKDLLISSSFTFGDALKQSFYINEKGYIIFLHFDNLDTLIDNQGSEGALFVLRTFIGSLKRQIAAPENIFSYNSRTIALKFAEIGQIEVINICEKIYELSKVHFFDDGSEDFLNITYIPVAYPQGYPTSVDLLRNINRIYLNKENRPNEDYIFFQDENYARIASKEKFMISVIEESFGNKKFEVMHQPMVETKTLHMYGAELLIRVKDDYRNLTYNTDELIRIAAKNNMTNIISKAMLEYLGSLYKQYGDNVFKNWRLNRLTINVDMNLLNDSSVISDISRLIKEYQIPDGFIGLEIGENDIYKDLEKLRVISKELKNLHVALICDRYDGKYITMDQLKELGFEEVKIDRKIVRFVDTSNDRYMEARAMMLRAHEVGLKASLVGVENLEQLKMLSEIDNDTHMQGYYFSRPLNKYDLVKAIQSSLK